MSINFTGKRGGNTVSTHQAGEGTGIKRRTIVQGVAWSVPVVVAAQALPAFATSPLDVTGTILGVCKYPGGSTSGGCKQDYRAQVQFCNNNPYSGDITTVSINYPATFGSSSLPFEALYQDGLRLISSNASGITGFLLQLGPFGGAYVHGWGIRVWALAYLLIVGVLALAAFVRKDL